MGSLMNSGFALFFLRFTHVFAGVIWIGLLYYFNFVQGAFMAEADAAGKSNVLQKLLPRALFWFRYAALWTMGIGLLLIGYSGHLAGNMAIYGTAWGINILTGAAMGLIMGANVWFIIWPNQKVVIANAVATAKGEPANPAAAACGAKALLASRTNVLFSLPMLFFMSAASHYNYAVRESASVGLYALIAGVIIAAIEFNAIKGKLGPLTTVRGVIHCGVGLVVLFLALIVALVAA